MTKMDWVTRKHESVVVNGAQNAIQPLPVSSAMTEVTALFARANREVTEALLGIPTVENTRSDPNYTSPEVAW